MKRRGLGGGLLAQGRGSDVADLLPALGATPEGGGEQLREIPLALIDRSPFQPRTSYDPARLRELADNIRASGLHHPVLVRPKPGGRFELLAGERRLEAVKLAKRKTVLARVREVDDLTAATIGLTENLAREDLSAWDEARGMAALREALKRSGRKATLDALAKLTGRSAGAISESLKIADRLSDERLQRVKGADLQSLKVLPKTTLLGAVRAESDAELGRLLGVRHPAGPGRAPRPAPRQRRGRPAEPYTFTMRDGRLRLDLRRPVAELPPARARALLDRLRPVVTALERRAKQRDTQR